MLTTGSKKPASLYFHIPFCTKKCPYCHFFVVPDREDHKEQFMIALEREWNLVHKSLMGFDVVSIYFGGGTPSLLGPERIQTILEWIEKSGLPIAADCEITLEVNPENVTPSLMKDFRKAGINRVSLGLQSLDDTLLNILGRTHTASKSVQAVQATYDAGITNISVDLMFELPHQDVRAWESTLAQVQTLPITHLSLYNLVIEPNTPFHKKKKEISLHLPSQEICSQMLDMAVTMLESFGLKRYEISAFAKEGYESRHNTGYWRARPFLGLGPSAFSYFEGKRFQNIANLSKYCTLLEKGILPKDFEEELPYPQNLKELLAVELRLLQGVDLVEFEGRHAKLPQEMKDSITQLIEKGWLERDGDRIKLTSQGLLFYDSVAEEII
ncbi:MAG: radical SAM family heme chaperone HemW [Chlamydiae bacterium]|nr:radical SAM family heme chaperone HemW [Chlamydiota bacterium]